MPVWNDGDLGISDVGKLPPSALSSLQLAVNLFRFALEVCEPPAASGVK